MQRDVKIGIAIGVLLIALIGIFWWVKSNQSSGDEVQLPPEVTDTSLVPPITPVDMQNGGGAVAGGSEIVAPGVTTTTMPGMTPPAGPVGPTGIQPPTPPAPPTPAEQTHTVASGDSLAKISKQYYGTEAKWKLIADANHLADPTKLKIGQKLVIPPADAAAVVPGGTTGGPAGSTDGATSTGSRTHKVVAGDTLTSISRKYYGDISHVDAIYQANKSKMASKNDLKVGTVLTIP